MRDTNGLEHQQQVKTGIQSAVMTLLLPPAYGRFWSRTTAVPLSASTACRSSPMFPLDNSGSLFGAHGIPLAGVVACSSCTMNRDSDRHQRAGLSFADATIGDTNCPGRSLTDHRYGDGHRRSAVTVCRVRVQPRRDRNGRCRCCRSGISVSEILPSLILLPLEDPFYVAHAPIQRPNTCMIWTDRWSTSIWPRLSRFHSRTDRANKLSCPVAPRSSTRANGRIAGRRDRSVVAAI